MLFAFQAVLISAFILCAVLSKERFRSAVLLTLAAFSSFVAIDFRLDSLEKKTTQMIETATTSELPVVWMETEVATGDTIYDFCAAAFESDVMECVQTFVLLNRDRFSSAIGNERDLWLVSTASYIIPIRLARSE